MRTHFWRNTSASEPLLRSGGGGVLWGKGWAGDGPHTRVFSFFFHDSFFLYFLLSELNLIIGTRLRKCRPSDPPPNALMRATRFNQFARRQTLRSCSSFNRVCHHTHGLPRNPRRLRRKGATSATPRGKQRISKNCCSPQRQQQVQRSLSEAGELSFCNHDSRKSGVVGAELTSTGAIFRLFERTRRVPFRALTIRPP